MGYNPTSDSVVLFGTLGCSSRDGRVLICRPKSPNTVAPLVGIATITATVKRGYEIADACRLHGIPVILSGPHVTFIPDEALAHATFGVRREDAGAMSALLDVRSEGCEDATDGRYAEVPDVSWKDGTGVIRHNAVAPWLTDLDALPVPDFSLAGGTADCVIGRRKTVMLQTSRGCPFDGSFYSATGRVGTESACSRSGNEWARCRHQ